MIYRFSSYAVDTERLELSGPSGPISLQPQAFSLLVFLIENADRVVSKDEVFDAVWQGRIVGDGTLNARINAIRTAVGDDGSRQEVVKTFPRQGFRFVATLGEATAPENSVPSQPAVRRSVQSLAPGRVRARPARAAGMDGPRCLERRSR